LTYYDTTTPSVVGRNVTSYTTSVVSPFIGQNTVIVSMTGENAQFISFGANTQIPQSDIVWIPKGSNVYDEVW